MEEKPNPGTEEAIQQGCTCPVMDNHYGQGRPNGQGGVEFWYNENCLIHGFKNIENPDQPDMFDSFSADKAANPDE
jgi:hypothetical protein